MELVIDRFINPKCKVETGIPKGSPVSPIFFPIYIREVFLDIQKQLSQITCLSFIDDFRFLVPGNSTLDVKKSQEKAGKITLG